MVLVPLNALVEITGDADVKHTTMAGHDVNAI